jgi:ADP-heptose:LPS heptosyltransferase
MKIHREGTQLNRRHFNLTLHKGGIGDFIAQLPTIKYILDNFSENYYHIWVHDYAKQLTEHFFGKYDNVFIKGMSESKKKYKNELAARSPYAHLISNLSAHMTEHAFLTLVGRTVDDNNLKNYLILDPIDVSHFNLPEKYVVVTTGFTSQSREWRGQSVNETVDYIISKGYTPVFLGKSYTQAYFNTGITGNFKADYTKGINLIDKTNLFEAASIMNDAACTVGLDNGLLHLCCLNPEAKVVYGFSTVLPEHRLPYRHGVKGYKCYVVDVSEDELECTGCQSKMNFAPTDHSFTGCFYKQEQFKCLDLLTSNKWIEQLEKIL